MPQQPGKKREAAAKAEKGSRSSRQGKQQGKNPVPAWQGDRLNGGKQVGQGGEYGYGASRGSAVRYRWVMV